VAYYYRHAFSLPADLKLDDVRLTALTDDGTQVFLNGRPLGTLAARDGTPDAKPPKDPSRPKRALHDVEIDPAWLTVGPNVLAVKLPKVRQGLDADELFNL